MNNCTVASFTGIGMRLVPAEIFSTALASVSG